MREKNSFGVILLMLLFVVAFFPVIPPPPATHDRLHDVNSPDDHSGVSRAFVLIAPSIPECTHVPYGHRIPILANDVDMVSFHWVLPLTYKTGGKFSLFLCLSYMYLTSGTVMFYQCYYWRGPASGSNSKPVPSAGENVVISQSGDGMWDGDSGDTCTLTITGSSTGYVAWEIECNQIFTAGDDMYISLVRYNSGETSHWNNQDLFLYMTIEQNL